MVTILKAGTEIRDDDGNLVATVRADTEYGQPISVDDFIWPVEKPEPGFPIHPAILRAAGL